MVRGPCTVRKRHLKIAIEAMKAAGVGVQRIEICQDGKIVIVTEKPEADTTNANPWDKALDDAAH
jgi:hypothetical protein